MVKGISYGPTDLIKITRLIKLDSAVYAITEVSEKEPAISIYKYIDGKQDVFYSSNNFVVSTNLYPSDKGFIFVEYVEGKSKLMEVDGKDVKRMFSIKGEVFDVTSIDGHTYFHLLDNDLLRVVDENGRESSFVFEEDQTVYFGDSIYSKVSHQDPLTLQYGTKEDIKNIEIEDKGPKEGIYSIFKVDKNSILLVKYGVVFVNVRVLTLK